MMILNELTLRRFRIHDNLTIKFSSGVTGIVGRNGTGKSSIIEAIGFLFTGETDDPKEQVITAGASGTAYVRGKFTLNGKEGVIERALDTSRVILEYDGQKLVKASEVRDMWAKMIQVDSHIFQHVIMAKQKKIPELFSGETAVREKAFQRIFMVPNTEKLRSLIWDGYIKTCPPPLPEDDVHAIDLQLARLRTELTPKEEKLLLMSTSVLSEQQMMAVLGYTDHYNRCIQDARKRPILEAQLAEAKANVESFVSQFTALGEQLRTIPEDLESQYAELVTKKEQYRQHLQAKSALASACETMQSLKVDPVALQAEIDELQQRCDTHRSAVMSNQLEVQKVRQEIHGLQNLSGAATCPTCHQPLTDVAQHLADAQSRLLSLTSDGAYAQSQLEAQREILQSRKAVLSQWHALNAQVQALNAQATGSYVEYDEARLMAVMTLRQHVQTTLTTMRQLDNARIQTEASVRVLEEQLKHLVEYTGNATPAEELTLMNEVLQRHRLRMQEIARWKRKSPRSALR
jgi:DNA repair exonuclease SbcCD ATPase subunit